MSNLVARWRKLFPTEARLYVGVVQSTEGGVAVIQLDGGGVIKARGVADVGDYVFAKGGAIEGPAPNLPSVSITV